MEERRFKPNWAKFFLIISKGYTNGLRASNEKGKNKNEKPALGNFCVKELMNLVRELWSAIPKCIFSIDDTNMHSVDKINCVNLKSIY